MTDQLERQLDIYIALTEVDQVALTDLDAERILTAFIVHFGKLVRCNVLGFLRADSGSTVLLHNDPADSSAIRSFVTELAPEENALLLACEDFLCFEGDHIQSKKFLTPFHTQTSVYAFPISYELRRLSGVMIMGFESSQAALPEDLELARKLVARVAIALSNVAWKQELYKQAHYDSLTQLPNRLLLEDRLDQALVRAERQNHCVAVMCLDLDHFKDVNDSLGHHVGDSLLNEVARVLGESIRKSDTVARMGGDEFIIVVPDQGKPERAVSTTNLVCRKIMNGMDRPFTFGGRVISITPSIGIAIYPRDGNTATHLLRNADSAMYQAKTQRRGTISYYAEEVNVAALE